MERAAAADKADGYHAAGLHLGRFHQYRELALTWWSIDTDQVFEGLVLER